MTTARWQLSNDRPSIQVTLSLAVGGEDVKRSLLADTGAGSRSDVFELILDEEDCLQCGGIPIQEVQLGGAFVGVFPVYLIDVRLPELDFDDSVPVVGVAQTPTGFEGIACFRFLNRFNYGNFGDRENFALESLE